MRNKLITLSTLAFISIFATACGDKDEDTAAAEDTAEEAE